MQLRTRAATYRTVGGTTPDASLLAGVISVAPVPLWVIGAGGEIVLANRAALVFLGHGSDDVAGGPSHDLLHRYRPDGSEYHAHNCPIVRSQGTGASSTEWFVTQQGDLRPVSWSTEPVGTSGMTLLHFAPATTDDPPPILGQLPEPRAHQAPVRPRDGMRERAYEIIRARFTDPDFSTSLLADEMHLSARSVQALFQDAGSSPAAEIRRVRLDHAYSMLERGHSVRTACLVSGFLDPDTFGRTFRRHFGYAPSRVGRQVLLPAG